MTGQRTRARCGIGTATVIAVAAGLLASPIGMGSAAAAVKCHERTVAAVRTPSALRLGGEYCQPSAQAAEAVVLLVPGVTHRHGRLALAPQPASRSFARALARAGYATVALNRLRGVKRSTKAQSATASAAPVSAADLTRAVQDLVARLRATGLQGKPADKIVVTGESVRSLAGMLTAAALKAIDGMVVTALKDRPDAAALKRAVEAVQQSLAPVTGAVAPSNLPGNAPYVVLQPPTPVVPVPAGANSLVDDLVSVLDAATSLDLPVVLTPTTWDVLGLTD